MPLQMLMMRSAHLLKYQTISLLERFDMNMGQAAILFILTLVLQFYFTFGTPSGVLTPAAVQESFLTEIFYDNNPLSHFLNVG